MKDFLIRVAKHAYRKISGKKFLPPECCCDRQQANDMIYSLLDRPDPCMISRFGTTELNCINNYVCVHSKQSYYKRIIDYITDYTHTPWWNKKHFKIMSIYSGIFPVCQDTAEKFSERYLKDIPEIDLLGSFQYYEKFMPLKKEIERVHLEMLYPFFVANPWTRALKNKNVLVIHPFADSINQQYLNRKFLFKNPSVLPDYNLITYKSVQSVAGIEVPYKSWFEALEYMENEISNIDFDIALIGCGAYGLPLAAHVKRMGKKAIHIGGGLQLLFGIKGKRWVQQYKDSLCYRNEITIDINYRKLFNEHWIFPLDSDTPIGASKVEDSCYWK